MDTKLQVVISTVRDDFYNILSAYESMRSAAFYDFMRNEYGEEWKPVSDVFFLAHSTYCWGRLDVITEDVKKAVDSIASED